MSLVPRGLADTGALLALLDRDDAWHVRCAEAFTRLPLPLATTAAVLAELFHLLGDNPAHVAAGWGLVRSGAFVVLPIDDADLEELASLMKKYGDCPMDFADATLVRLASRERLTTVFTVDRNDFTTYRIDGRKRFTIVP